MADRSSKSGNRAVTRISKQDWQAAENHARQVADKLDSHSRAIERLGNITVWLSASVILEGIALVLIGVLR